MMIFLPLPSLISKLSQTNDHSKIHFPEASMFPSHFPNCFHSEGTLWALGKALAVVQVPTYRPCPVSDRWTYNSKPLLQVKSGSQTFIWSKNSTVTLVGFSCPFWKFSVFFPHVTSPQRLLWWKGRVLLCLARWVNDYCKSVWEMWNPRHEVRHSEKRILR